MWWSAALSFVGALVGAAVPVWATVRGQRQEGRSEWRQRLDTAITYLTSRRAAEQRIGEELLADLIRSDLGSDSGRALARRVARIAVTAGAQEPDTGPAPPAGRE